MRRALARRYLPGLTPGYDVRANLGGNVHRRPRPQVNRWRATYVQERARSGAAGGNSPPGVMHDVLSADSAALSSSSSEAAAPRRQPLRGAR